MAVTPFDHPIAFGHGKTTDDAIDDALDAAFQVSPLMRAPADRPEDVRIRAEYAVRAAFAARAARGHRDD